MKKYLPLILALLILTFSGATGAFALSTFATVQGGTGTTTPSGILYGDNGATNHLNTVTLTTSGSSGPSTFSGGTLNIPQYTGGGGGTGLSTSTPIAGSNLLVYSASGAGSAYGVATSTLTASSPLTGSFTHVGSTGSLGCQTASGSQAGCLSSTDWTTFNNKGSGTVTAIGVTTNQGVSGVSSGGATPNLTISLGALAGVTSFNGLVVTPNTGVITTGTWNGTAITNANLANSTISGIALGGTLAALSATNATLTFSGSYTGAATQTVGLNLSNPNTWTGLQQFNANASTTQLTDSGNLYLTALTGTQCLQEIAGVVSGTGSACGSGGGGTNFFTNSGTNTFLNTGSNLEAPFFTATSTTATSTFNGDVWIGSTGVLPNPDLRIGTSSLPLYGRVLGDVIDAEYDYNGVTSANVANANVGTCAASTYFADGNNPTLGGYYGTFSFLNDGWTNGGGAGCGIGVSNTDKPEAVAIVNPTGEMDFDIASSSAAAGFADFNWNVNNLNVMKLTNGGNLGVGTTSPYAKVSIATAPGASGVQQILFAVASSTGGTATNTLFSVQTGGNANGTVNVGGIINILANALSGAINYQGNPRIGFSSTGVSLTAPASSGTLAAKFSLNTNADSGLIAGANVNYLQLNFNQIHTHNAGNIAENDEVLEFPGIERFGAGTASVIATSSAFTIQGAPTIGVLGAQTNAYTLLLNATTTLTSASTTNSYALGAVANSGAANNYAIFSMGRILATNLNTSTAGNAVCQLTTGELVNSGASTCVTSSKYTKYDINSLSPQQAMQEILGLDITTYKYDDSGAVGVGPIAEQAAKVASNIVDYADRDFTLDGHKFKKGDAVGLEPLSEAGLALAGVKYEQTEILAIKMGHDIQDNWQDLFIGLLLSAVGYLYYEVRKLKRL